MNHLVSMRQTRLNATWSLKRVVDHSPAGYRDDDPLKKADPPTIPCPSLFPLA
ncbi:MAG TPA: hypothetical protein VIS99_10155 [Terrimicrobiaceae bacterium]